MSNINTSLALGTMGFKVTRQQEFKARVAAKKKIGDLSYKPSDAQKRAIFASELKKAEASAPAPKAEAPKAEAPKAETVHEMRIRKMAELSAKKASAPIEDKSKKPEDYAVGKKFMTTEGMYEVIAKDHHLPRKWGDSFYAKKEGNKNARKFSVLPFKHHTGKGTEFVVKLYVVKSKKSDYNYTREFHQAEIDDSSHHPGTYEEALKRHRNQGAVKNGSLSEYVHASEIKE